MALAMVARMGKLSLFLAIAKALISKGLDVIFGCPHWNYSFPITINEGKKTNYQAHVASGTYVVCHKCGRDLPYDWENMKVISPIDTIIKEYDSQKHGFSLLRETND